MNTAVSLSTPSATGAASADAFLASMARHGGRLITAKLVERLTVHAEASEREAALNRESLSGELGDVAVHRTWHYSIDPAGGGSQTCDVLNAVAGLRYATGSKAAWADVAEGLAKAGGDRDLGYLRARRGTVPLAAFDWPIYRAAMQATAVAGAN